MNRTLVETARIALAFIWAPVVAGAQINGVIADSIAGRRVPGAVVIVYDSSQRIISRALADDSGRFRIESTPGARRLRIVKIGYRPAERSVSPPATVRVMMEALPSLLEPMRTSDQPRCPRNATRPAAFGLWEQARAALLGTVVARETNTAQVMRISYRRYMAESGDSVARQSVRLDSGLAMRSFDASYPASEFGRRGFAHREGTENLRFFGPDAEVLLDDALIDFYCLELASPRSDRPNQAGLRFRPMGRETGRVDLDGTLWIDTVARVLEDIQYAYLGLEPWATQWRPGGRIGFAETSPATVWIDAWSIRMTGASVDTGGRPVIPNYTYRPRIVEGGAQLARASWPDGRVWKASLGAVEIHVTMRNAAPLRGARLWLDSTDYSGVTNDAGVVTIPDLLPGPYTISIFDSTLAVVDTALPAAPRFVATPDSVDRLTASVPTLLEFVREGCLAQNAFDDRSHAIVARIVNADGTPAVGADWRLESVGRDVLAPDGYYGEGRVGGEGMAYFCRRLSRDKRVILRAWPAGEKPGTREAEARLVLAERVTTVKLTLPP